MPARQGTEDREIERGTQSMLQSTVYAQPWWHGVGDNASSGETAPKLSHQNGSGLDNVVQPTAALQSDGHANHSSLKTVTVAEHSDPNSKMELVGHSIVLTSYPYSDQQYGGIYGPLVHPQLYGMHHQRMPLPLDMEEEPVYVNAKQYHGILRRRQSRAKAELEKKVIKVRKPYLHESRHQHALRRARGCGGRFLNTKKVDGNNSNSTLEKADESGAKHYSGSSSSSELFHHNGNGHNSSLYYPKSRDGDCSGQRMQMNGASRGAVPIK